MHEILGDLRGFTGLFDSVIGNMSDLSRDIVKYVIFQTPELDPYSQASGLDKSRRNINPDISTAGRTAGTRVTRGPRCCIKIDTFHD